MFSVSQLLLFFLKTLLTKSFVNKPDLKNKLTLTFCFVLIINNGSRRIVSNAECIYLKIIITFLPLYVTTCSLNNMSWLSKIMFVFFLYTPLKSSIRPETFLCLMKIFYKIDSVQVEVEVCLEEFAPGFTPLHRSQFYTKDYLKYKNKFMNQ